MERTRRAQLVSVVVLATAICASAEVRKEFRFTVSPGAVISITNQYGPISVKPGASSQVVVVAVLHSEQVEIDVLRAEGLHGDVTLEGSQASVEVRDISDAHVHVRTLNGSVALTNIRNGHVEVTSVTGDVVLNSVNGPLVQVNSTSGKIHYEGDFGNSGEYMLTSHSGDIEASAPNDASIDVTARSVRGKVENDFLLEPKHTPFVVRAGSAFAGTMNKAASSVRLFSFSGKIHLKKR
jgi:hypothetical protein